MLKTDKERIVSELDAELSEAETLIVADYVTCSSSTAPASASSRTR